jgi:hypothetical protein
MEERPSFFVDVPADFTHRFANIYSAETHNPSGSARYGCCFPADGLPLELVKEGVPGTWRKDGEYRNHVHVKDGSVAYTRATSVTPPIIMPGECDIRDVVKWKHVLDLVATTNLPRDWLFRERELRLRVQPYDWENDMQGRGVSLRLTAVQVMDLEEGFIGRYLREMLRGCRD